MRTETSTSRVAAAKAQLSAVRFGASSIGQHEEQGEPFRSEQKNERHREESDTRRSKRRDERGGFTRGPEVNDRVEQYE